MGSELVRNDAWGLGEVEIETAYGVHVLWQREWAVAGHKNPDPKWHAHQRALLAAREDSLTDLELGPEYVEKYSVGDAVEACYNKQSSQRWYPGVIARVHGNRLYDVQFNDGDFEERVRRRHVRLVAAVAGSSGNGSSSVEAGGGGEAGGEAGAAVEPNRAGEVNSNESSQVNTNTAGKVSMPTRPTRSHVPPPALRVNDRVECLSKGSVNVWSPGVIIYVNVGYNRGDTFDVAFDGGTYENRLPASKVRRRITPHKTGGDIGLDMAGTAGRKVLHVGNLVSCDVGGKRSTGRVISINSNGSFDVALEGPGGTENNSSANNTTSAAVVSVVEREVDGENLTRLEPDYRALKRKVFVEGERVEALFGGSIFAGTGVGTEQGQQPWRWGRVVRADPVNDCYDVEYDATAAVPTTTTTTTTATATATSGTTDAPNTATVGDFERNIPSARLRRKEGVVYTVGDRVQTRCHGIATEFVRARGGAVANGGSGAADVNDDTAEDGGSNTNRTIRKINNNNNKSNNRPSLWISGVVIAVHREDKSYDIRLGGTGGGSSSSGSERGGSGRGSSSSSIQHHHQQQQEEVFRRVRTDNIRRDPNPSEAEDTHLNPNAKPFLKGDNVEAQYSSGNGKWYRAVIDTVRFDGTFDVVYTDADTPDGGERDERLSAHQLRWPKGTLYKDLIIAYQEKNKSAPSSRPGSGGGGLINGVKRLLQGIVGSGLPESGTGSREGSRPNSSNHSNNNTKGPYKAKTSVELLQAAANAVKATEQQVLDGQLQTQLIAVADQLQRQHQDQGQAAMDAGNGTLSTSLPREHALAQARTLRAAADTKAREMLAAVLSQLELYVDSKSTSWLVDGLLPKSLGSVESGALPGRDSDSAVGGGTELETQDQRKMQLLTVHLRTEFARLMKQQRNHDVAGAVLAAVEVPTEQALSALSGAKTVSIMYRVVSLVTVLANSSELEESTRLVLLEGDRQDSKHDEGKEEQEKQQQKVGAVNLSLQVSDAMQRLDEAEARAMEQCMLDKKTQQYEVYKEQAHKRREKEQAGIMANSFYDHLNMEGIKKLAGENIREKEAEEIRGLNEMLSRVFSDYIQKVLRDHKQRQAAGTIEAAFVPPLEVLIEQGREFLHNSFAKAKRLRDELDQAAANTTATDDAADDKGINATEQGPIKPKETAGMIVQRVLALQAALENSNTYVQYQQSSTAEPLILSVADAKRLFTPALQSLPYEAAVALEDLCLDMRDNCYSTLTQSLLPSRREELIEFMMESSLYEHLNTAEIKKIADQHMIGLEAEEVRSANEVLAEVMAGYMTKLTREQQNDVPGEIKNKGTSEYKKEGSVFLEDLLAVTQALKEESRPAVTARLVGAGAPKNLSNTDVAVPTGGVAHWTSTATDLTTTTATATATSALRPVAPTVPVTVREVRHVRPRLVRGASNANTNNNNNSNNSTATTDPTAAAITVIDRANPSTATAALLTSKTDSIAAAEPVGFSLTGNHAPTQLSQFPPIKPPIKPAAGITATNITSPMTTPDAVKVTTSPVPVKPKPNNSLMDIAALNSSVTLSASDSASSDAGVDAGSGSGTAAIALRNSSLSPTASPLSSRSIKRIMSKNSANLLKEKDKNKDKDKDKEAEATGDAFDRLI